MPLPTYDELRAMSDEEVARQYNAQAERGSSGFGFWREELWRREVERQLRASEQLSASAVESQRRTEVLTWVIAALTVVNVAVVVASLV